MHRTVSSCRLYAITPPRIDLAEFVPQLEAAFKGGDIGCLQLRLKDASQAEIRAAVAALLPICHAHEAALVLNDHLDLACELPVDGVHLGQEDLLLFDRGSAESLPPSRGEVRRGGTVEDSKVVCLPPTPTLPPKGGGGISAIRRRLGAEKILGITCHASTHLAMEAGEQGADYVAFGAFYPTTSKPQEKLEKWGTPTREMLEGWAHFSTIPCVAIGGITPQNCAPLVKAGADFIAVITGIWNHSAGPQAAVAEYNAAIAAAHK